MANITKQASTRFSIVKRSKGQSAVEKASYISRSILVSEYDGQTYRPKYHEDLVHSEISLPQNAPREYADRATLWNAVELSEKGQKSQLARMLKASLPNEWSYELAEEVVRDYVQRNFVDKGMCADWAIHDSENDKGQRNLHIHVLLTMRPLTENGEWGAKTKKVYVLDENGERIPLIDKKTGKQKVDKRNRKQWKCQTVESTDWNSRESCINCHNPRCMKLGRDEIECKSFPGMSHDMNLDICPANAIKQNSNQVTIDERKCFGCGLCVSRCPVGALYIKNEKAEVNLDNDLPRRKAQPSSAALKEQERAITNLLGIKHTGNMIMESEASMNKIYRKIKRLPQEQQNLFARNILICLSNNATISRHGDVYLRMDGYYENTDKHGVVH